MRLYEPEGADLMTCFDNARLGRVETDYYWLQHDGTVVELGVINPMDGEVAVYVRDEGEAIDAMKEDFHDGYRVASVSEEWNEMLKRHDQESILEGLNDSGSA